MASGVELATAYVTLTASTRGMGRDVAREFAGIEKQADTSGKRAGKRFSGGIATSIKAAGILGAAAGVASILGDSISEAREAQKVGAITTQVIKTTGGAAKVTAGQVGALSTAISNKTGVDDEAIQTGANMLLTFKNVRNEVGTGSKIFDRATQAAADLSAAGFGSMSTTSKQLGKALNDPVKGMAALGKSGVTFTDQQKEQIKTLVKSGDVLGAQKIILKEVESQVGGTAEASATAGEKLATTFGNFKEGIGTALLPVIDTVFTKLSDFIGYLTTNIGPALGKVGDFFKPVIDTVKLFFGLLSGHAVPVQLPWAPTVIGVAMKVRGVWDTVVDLFRTILPPAIQIAKDAFTVIVAYIRDEIIPRVMGIAQAIGDFVAVAVPIVKAFVAGMIERIKPLMPTIKAIFGTIGDIITGALDLIKAVIERVTAVIKFIWERWGQGIMDFIADIWAKILGVIQPALEGIQGLIKTFTAIFKGDWKAAWESLKGVFSSVWKTLRGVIDLALTLLGKALSIAWSGIVTTAGRIWDGITGAIAGPLDRVMEFIQENFIDKINGLFAFLRIPVHIEPIWKPNNVGTGGWKNGREAFGRGGSRRSEGGMGGALPSSGGGLSRPVSQPVGTGFGGYPGHKGVDFLTPIGTPVRSLMSGTVVRDGWDPGGFGYHVRTRDADGDMTIFGHLTRDVVSVGQQIAKGQVIGYSGNTGNSSGPHLHVERRDPPYSSASAYNWLTGAGAPAGAGFNPVADLLRNGIASIASGASGFASKVGGPFGPVFANILERLVKGVGARGLSLLGMDGGELRPRLYDQGGMIPPGDTLVRNLTGKPETLLPFDVTRGGLGRELHIHVDGAGLSPDEIVAAAYKQERRDAALHRNYAVR